MRRWLVAVTMLGLTVALVQPAGADPAKIKFSVSFPATCNGTATTIVVNFRAEGSFVAAFDLNSTSVFVPTAFSISGTFTFDGQTEPFTFEDAKPGNASALGNVTCTFTDVNASPFPGATVTFSGTATGFFTPRG